MAEFDEHLCGVAGAVLEDGLARLGVLYGLPLLLARAYAVALLSLDDVSVRDVARLTGSPAPSVATAMRKLVAAGLLVRRNERYDAAPAPWAGFVAWRRLRVSREVAALRDIGDFLDRALAGVDGPASTDLHARVARIRRLTAGYDPVRTEARTDRRPTARAFVVTPRRAPCGASASGTRTRCRCARRRP